MKTEVESDPTYDLLLEELVEKTRSGKLRWQPTANENTYLAAVKNLYTFEVNSNDQGSVQVLRLRDDKQNILAKITRGFDPLLGELHELARRSAFQIDEKLDQALQVLKQL